MKLVLAFTTLFSMTGPIYSALSTLQVNPLITPQEIEVIVQKQGLANTVSIIFLFISVIVAIYLLRHIGRLTDANMKLSEANIQQTKSHQEGVQVIINTHLESTKLLVEDNRKFLSERMLSMDKATQLAHDVVECFGPAARKKDV